MTRSAKSVLVFALYLFVLGPTLLVAPNFLLSLFGVAETTDVWIRVVGMLVTLLGFYYVQAARHGLATFLHATVWARGSVVVFFAAFVALKLAPPILVLFGAIDLVGAIWTFLCLRAESLEAVAQS